MAITLQQLQQHLRSADYTALTGGDDTVAQRALDNASVYVATKMNASGITVDTEDPAVQQATLKRAIYELYCYAQQPEAAQDELRDADTLLSLKGAAQTEPRKPLPAVAVASGSTDWKNFR